LAERNLHVQEIFRWPEEDDEIAERVLAGVEVIDGFDVETLCGANVLEDLPVSACRSVGLLAWLPHSIGCSGRAYEHWNNVTKKQAKFSDMV
jgi:hypothetical protein